MHAVCAVDVYKYCCSVRVSLMYISFSFFLMWCFVFFEAVAALYGDSDKEASNIQEIQHVAKFTEQKTVESNKYLHSVSTSSYIPRVKWMEYVTATHLSCAEVKNE
jgi:hypothetical protein